MIDFDTKPQRRPVTLPDRLLTLPCAVCGTPASVIAGAVIRLCATCRADLPAARQQAQQRFDNAVAAFEAEERAYETYQSSLDAEVARRWAALLDHRTRAQHALDVALHGSYRTDKDAAERRRIIAACQQRYDDELAKIKRTRQNAANPLSALLAREGRYEAARRHAETETRAATIALQELDAAEGASIL